MDTDKDLKKEVADIGGSNLKREGESAGTENKWLTSKKGRQVGRHKKEVAEISKWKC